MVHEDNIKILSKFLARTNLRCTQWMRVKGMVNLTAPSRTSQAGVMEYVADFESIEPLIDDTSLPYKVMGFDIEVYSSVPNRFPIPFIVKDETFAISVVTETFPGV